MMLCIAYHDVSKQPSKFESAPSSKVCLLLFSFEFREVLVLELSPGRIGASKG